jgi:hypothetical protein
LKEKINKLLTCGSHKNPKVDKSELCLATSARGSLQLEIVLSRLKTRISAHCNEFSQNRCFFAISPNSGGFAYFPHKCGDFLELTPPFLERLLHLDRSGHMRISVIFAPRLETLCCLYNHFFLPPLSDSCLAPRLFRLPSAFLLQACMLHLFSAPAYHVMLSCKCDTGIAVH